MAVVSFSARARHDLLQLWRWYAGKGGPELVDAIVDRIRQRVIPLARFPEMGPPRPDIASSARVLVVHRWLVLYEVANGHVRVVRVVDGATDLRRLAWKE